MPTAYEDIETKRKLVYRVAELTVTKVMAEREGHVGLVALSAAELTSLYLNTPDLEYLIFLVEINTLIRGEVAYGKS